MTLVIEHLYCPYYITIKKTDQHYTLTSNCSFKKGGLIYKIECLPIKQNQNILYKFKNSYFECNLKKQTINKGGYRQFTYFDMFMNHSCDPNTILQYSDKDCFRMIAKKDISIGEELTVDYTTFDIYNDDYMFECKC